MTDASIHLDICSPFASFASSASFRPASARVNMRTAAALRFSASFTSDSAVRDSITFMIASAAVFFSSAESCLEGSKIAGANFSLITASAAGDAVAKISANIAVRLAAALTAAVFAST